MNSLPGRLFRITINNNLQMNNLQETKMRTGFKLSLELPFDNPNSLNGNISHDFGHF